MPNDPRRHAGTFQPVDPKDPPRQIRRQAGNQTELARDVQARLAIVEARKNFMRQLFGGTQLVTCPFVAGENSANITKQLYEVSNQVKNCILRPPPATNFLKTLARNHVLKLLQDIFDTTEISEILEELSETVFGEIVEALTPFIGGITTGASGLVQLGLAAKEAWKVHKIKQYTRAVLPGDPKAAADALREVIARDATQKAITGGRELATAGSRIGCVFLDGGVVSGPVLGLANALAGLAQYIFVVARDYKEKKAVNAILAHPEQIDAKVFMVCPILGAYYLSCADTSMIVNLLVEDIGTEGWMTNVEKLVKESIEPLVETAVDKIAKSRFTLKRIGENGELLDLISNKGTVIRGHGTVANFKRKVHNFKKKVTAALHKRRR